MSLLASELQRAVHHHQAGELIAAENLYRKILRTDPRHPDALHLLGVAAHQQKRHEEAVQHITRALAADASQALYHCNLGSAYRALGRTGEAVTSFREALRIDPTLSGAHYNLGMALEDAGQQNEAADSYRAAIDVEPRYLEAHNNLGRLHASRGEHEAAAMAFHNAIAAHPGFAPAHYNLGNALAAAGDCLAAVNAFETAIRLLPDVPEFHNNLGTALKDLGRREEASACFRKALSLRPQYAEARNNLGSVLHALGDLAAAESCFRAACCVRPAFAGALTNLGNIHNDRGDLAAAIDFYNQALRHEPQSAEAHFNRALAWLRDGNFSRGWAEYEWRWQRKVAPRGFIERQWNGEPLKGRSIFLYAEQGIGDEIQFASCVPDMLAQCDRCLVECDPRLVPLFARSFPKAQVIGRPIRRDACSGAVEPSIDYQLALGSLPRFHRQTAKSFPARAGYLVPDEKRVSESRQHLKMVRAGLNVGITWRGGNDRDLRQRRSTTLSQWMPLLELSGIRFIVLQYGHCSDEIAECQRSNGVALEDLPEIDRWNDLDGLAAGISALDLVITVDNSTAHLAGALGIPVWTLLPFVADWRWMLNGDASPWYPQMRLFRQPEPGDWATVFARVARALMEFRNHWSQILGT